MPGKALKPHLNERAWKVLDRADKHCRDIIKQVTSESTRYLTEHRLPAEDVCFVVVGSVGRQEALQASDIDFVPVLRSPEALNVFKPHDKPIRQRLRDALAIDVSKGEDLTQLIDLPQLTDPDTIGGPRDESNVLTRRLLILTESRQAGGKLALPEVRQKVMQAYARSERTRGRHVLSLCNDIARYYRTVCIEYKAKADDPAKDWCTRNVKLRHSRKFWYFSCVMAIVALADSNPQGDDKYIEGLLKAFEKAPVQRLFDAVREEQRGMVGRTTEAFTWFLDFMGNADHRAKLAQVSHEHRYDMTLDNPFHAVKFNSDRLHQELLTLIDSLPAHQRHRILSWFLL